MNTLRTSHWSKKFSVFLAFIFMVSFFTPTQTWALSTGPGQPELEGFAPASMDEMVNVFTGDFSYNIPLLNVPGPNGGYPINLSYSAGIQMEQEASWVGLGWSLNPGVVNREVRGLPDDFNGQKISKKLSQKPNQTFGANIALANLETFGADAKKFGLNLSANVNLFYNNYRGFTVEPGLGFSLMDAKDRRSAGAASPEKVIDEETGQSESSPSFPFKIRMNEAKEEKKSIFANPVQSFGAHYKNLWKKTLKNPGRLFSSTAAPLVSDINYTHPMTSSSYTLNVKTGIEVFGVSGDLQVNAYYSELKVDDESKNVPGYGYLYSDHNLSNSTSGLMDFTLGNQSLLTPDSRILPVPNHTYDVFHVSSQGVSGTVRAFKGGVSKLIDPSVKSRKKNIGGGFELNSLLICNKVGINLNAGAGSSYVGPWESGDEALNFLNTSLKSLRTNQPLIEPYYFKFANELSAEVNSNTVHTDKDASRFNLVKKSGLFASEAKVQSSLQGSPVIGSLGSQNAYRYEREKRAKSFIALTEEEAAAYDGYVRSVVKVDNPSLPVNINFETSVSPKKDQIGAIHIRDENGMKYVYGIPAKNKLQKQTTFSTGAQYGSTLADIITKSKSYLSTENSLSNSSGTDHFYAATEIPEHAHSYLLTEIVSEDYVDINENGPDKTDFGSYTKFGYSVKQGFKSKSPAVGADYLPGNLSNTGDDKGTLTYFEKDLYYLRSVETKSHVAIFDVEPRADAYGVTGENGSPSASVSQYRLKSITLYNVDDYEENGNSAQPIKTIHFTYSYELCSGVPNGASGKLTLKKVWYSVGTEKTKMSLSPYEFTYANNYAYKDDHVDRWATYQDNSQNNFGSNILYPYTVQNPQHANAYAAAWNLKTITLPTGGSISVDYEADDYQYVQNRKAQKMCEVVGFSGSGGGTSSTTLSTSAKWMVIKVPEIINSEQQAKQYISGLDQVYYKIFMKMKKFGRANLAPSGSTPFNQSGIAYDFVEGYVKLTNEVDYIPGSQFLFVKMKTQGNYHPVSRAGWAHLRTARTDLLDDSNISLDAFSNFSVSALTAIGTIISKAIKFMVDEGSFFVKAKLKGWCDRMDNSTMKSIVRLNAWGKKIGGGHRVREIKISDMWSQMGGSSTSTYGQRYNYILPDGSSSGVAQYEPLTGGEENPFREPVRYSTDKILFKDNDLYTELPVGEDFFPAASVGYSRVVINNLANDVVTHGGAGVQVHEFYTAKDYPVQTSRTDIHKVNTDLKEKLITFIGNKKYFQPGFSQGYSIEVNNMHGQKKSEATYVANSNLAFASPVQKTTYYYRTEGGYLEGKTNKLDNEVRVIDPNEGGELQKEIGVTQDTYVYMGESNERTYSGSIDGDVDAILFVVVPTAWPTIDYSYTMTRTVVLNKVVSRAGILEKVVSVHKGAETTQEHTAFDPESGIPIISYLTNEFNDTISTANMLARWTYPRMGPSYQNEGVTIEGPISNYTAHLLPGDMLINPATQQKAWVTANGGNLVVRKKDGTQLSSPQLQGYKVIRSGYSNKLTASLTSVQAKTDPTGLVNGGGSLSGVLQSSAIEYHDGLKRTMELNPDLFSHSDTAGLALNPYAYGMKGIYKPYRTYFYLEDRSQTKEGQTDYDFHTDIREDGAYKSFARFSPGGGNGWYLSNEITLYDHNGTPLEERDALGNYSAVLYGFDRNLPVSIAKNAQYTEIAFESFEDYTHDGFSTPEYTDDNESTHLKLDGVFELSTKKDAHTGDYSIVLANGDAETDLNEWLSLSSNKQYLVQAWRKSGIDGALSVEDNSGNIIPGKVVSPEVEGWELVEIVFTAGAYQKLIFEGEDSQYDDIKIHPLDAGFKAYVYDRYSHRLIAELDENHFAMTYSYDHDGALVKTAKETERGYKTIQSTLRNTNQRPGSPQL